MLATQNNEMRTNMMKLTTPTSSVRSAIFLIIECIDIFKIQDALHAWREELHLATAVYIAPMQFKEYFQLEFIRPLDTDKHNLK